MTIRWQRAGSNNHRKFTRLAKCRFQDPPNDDLMLGPVHPAVEESWNVKYLCLVYEDEGKVDALPERESSTIGDEDRAYLDELRMAASGRHALIDRSGTANKKADSRSAHPSDGVGADPPPCWRR